MPRYDLDLNEILVGKVKELSNDLGISEQQVILDAISTFDVLCREIKRGYDIASVEDYRIKAIIELPHEQK